MLEATGGPLRPFRLGAGPNREIWRRSGHQIERPLPCQQTRIAEIAVANFDPIGGAVPSELREAMAAERTCTSTPNPRACGRREARNDATLPIPVPRSSQRAGAGLAQKQCGQLFHRQIVERSAMAIKSLQDAPVAC